MQFRNVHIGGEYAFNPQKGLIGTRIGYQSRVKVLKETTVPEFPHRMNARRIKGFQVKLVKAGSHASGPSRKGTVFECRAADLVRTWEEEEALVRDYEERERLHEQSNLVRDIKVVHLRCRLAARGYTDEAYATTGGGDYGVSTLRGGDAEFRLDLEQMAALVGNRVTPAIDDTRIGHLPYKVTVQSGRVKLRGKRNRTTRFRLMCHGAPVTGWQAEERIRKMYAVLEGLEEMPPDPFDNEEDE